MMERIRFLSVALLAGIVVLLSLQNLHDVEVHLLAWHFGLSVALLTLGSFLCGLVVGSLAMLVGRRRRGPRGRRGEPALEAEQDAVPAQAIAAEPTEMVPDAVQGSEADTAPGAR